MPTPSEAQMATQGRYNDVRGEIAAKTETIKQLYDEFFDTEDFTRKRKKMKEIVRLTNERLDLIKESIGLQKALDTPDWAWYHRHSTV